MAAETFVMSSNTSLHPFFTKQTETLPQSRPTAAQVEHQVQRHNKSRSGNGSTGAIDRHQATLHHLLAHGTRLTGSEDELGEDAENDDNIERRKRRRISNEDSTVAGSEQTKVEIVSRSPEEHGAIATSTQAARAEGHSGHDTPVTTAPQNDVKTPPKKMLKLNLNGKFGSPTALIEGDADAVGTNRRRRGRPRKAKEPAPVKSLIVCLKYTSLASSTGEKINAILEGKLVIEVTKPSVKKARTPRKPKSTHPFFSEKQKPSKTMSIASPRKTAAITPGKLRIQAASERGPSSEDSATVWESALLKDRLLTRHAGAREPLWPARGINHVRGFSATHNTPTLSRRKHKHTLQPVPTSLLTTFAAQLKPEPEPRKRADGFREPPVDLYVPDKLLISGYQIATAVAKELTAPVLQGDADELAMDSSQAQPHSAISHAFSGIPNYLSAFDCLRGEHLSWVQRSAPQATEQVLQPLKEMRILKHWLQAMAVNAVDSKPEHTEQDTANRQKKKKRKHRPADLDDFLVDDESDVGTLDAVADDEAPGSQSLVESHNHGTRPSNVILISGPHGCGKTAAVYAIAKELQYRVFEISSAERRSGKDVLDKIGNVTENHIVKRHNADSEAELSGTEDRDRVDSALKLDIETGRQGKMNTFFKPMRKSKPARSDTTKTKTVNNLKTALKKAAKEQQQSLILLEEVDVLFKEDREFWSTIFRLVQTSKRPFIMTCNDEQLVPSQALQLHAVLRFAPPPDDLAIDYLLLIAAKEGHLLQRAAVADLWQQCKHDLRQSLTTLDFWCRMGVGDIRDGLGWIYQRWPVGSDLDAHGRPLRVVSRDTYRSGIIEREVVVSTKALPADLKTYSAAAELLSSIDTFSTVPSLDTTRPPLPQRQRQNYVEGLAVLDAPSLTDFTGLHQRIIQTAYTYASLEQHSSPRADLDRRAFAAFDRLAPPMTASGMEESVFDGPFKPLVTDVAPFVRQVLRYETSLRGQREAMAGPVARARKTRVARSALEGGQRQLTRREEWWEGSSEMQDALLTAGLTWADHLPEDTFRDNDEMT